MNFKLTQPSSSIILFALFTFAASDTEFICFHFDKVYKDVGTATEILRSCGIESVRSMGNLTNMKKVICTLDKYNALTNLKLPKPEVILELINYHTEPDKLETIKQIFKHCSHPEQLADLAKFSYCFFTKTSDMCDDVQMNGPI